MTRCSQYNLIAISLVAALTSPALRADDTAQALSLPGLFDEVVTKTKAKHVYDWKRATYELQLGYGTVDEKNNFENAAWDLGFGVPTDSGWIFGGGLRRVIMASTASSDDVGRGPFTQDAQMTRYELYMNANWRILEGRAMTALTPWISDLEMATFLILGFHFNHPNKGNMPKKTDKPAPYTGQRQVNAEHVFELGLKWQVYTPQSFGMFFTIERQMPILGNTGNLGAFNYLSGGILWSFGAS